MSYATYLSNKMAAQKKIVNVRNPTDASMVTQKIRFEANQTFFANGQGKGSLMMDTSRPNGTPLLQHAGTSFSKASTRPAAASDFTAYRGGQGIRDDSVYKNGVKKTVDYCCDMPTVDGSLYRTASDATKTLQCANQKLGDSPKFVDNTIRLSAMIPEMVNGGCCDNSIVEANHTHSEGIHPPTHPSRAVNEHTFMAAPPQFQNQGVGGRRAGAYYNPRSAYVENKHGNDLRVNPRRTPAPFILDGTAPAHLKINDPTQANVKPF